MKSVEDKTWNIFKVEIHEKSTSVVEDRSLKIYYCHKLGISNEKCGAQKLEYFQISNSGKKNKCCEGRKNRTFITFLS